MQSNSISAYTTQQLMEWKGLYESWFGVPISYKAILDELEIRERSDATRAAMRKLKQKLEIRNRDSQSVNDTEPPF